MPAGQAYLVAFVADPALDAHADALREVARRVAGAGFFDDAEEGPRRTVGAFVRAAAVDEATVRELLREAAEVSAAFGVRMEVQFAEELLGFLEAGRPDAALTRALGGGPAGGTPGAWPGP